MPEIIRPDEPSFYMNFITRFPYMAAYMLKTSRHGKPAVIADCFQYLFGFLKWRISLAIIRPLNFLRETSIMIIARKWFCKTFSNQYYHESDMPVNLAPEDRGRFLKNYYILKPLEILHLKNHSIYLTAYHGIVFKNFRIEPKSVHGKWDQRNVELLKPYYPLAMNAWMYALHEKNERLNSLDDDKQYLLAHHWFNYYHWLTETLPRIWVMKDQINDYVILLPASFRDAPFVRLSLEALKINNIKYVEEGVMRVKNLTLVENKPYCNHYFPHLARESGNYFSEYVKKQNISVPDFGDKIFISRKKAERRKLVNEEEVERLLSNFGFKPVYIEDHDFFQQIAIMGKAKYLIGMHGAGLTNMLFMPQGGKILELHREIYSGSDLFSDVYWNLASALGHQYYYQFCEPENKQEDFFTVNYKVDLEKLRENVGRFVKN